MRDRKKPHTETKVSDNLQDIRIRNDHRTNWAATFQLSNAQIAYVWHPSTAPDVSIQALRDGNYQPRQTIVWLKNRATLSRAAYHWKHEACIYAVRVGENANWLGDRKQHTVWEANSVEPKHRIHPTQKPIELYLKPIEHHTEKKELVYDPFAGSGVVFSACEELGRTAYGIDLEPHYCEKILERFERETGKTPKLEGNIFN